MRVVLWILLIIGQCLGGSLRCDLESSDGGISRSCNITSINRKICETERFTLLPCGRYTRLLHTTLYHLNVTNNQTYIGCSCQTDPTSVPTLSPTTSPTKAPSRAPTTPPVPTINSPTIPPTIPPLSTIFTLNASFNGSAHHAQYGENVLLSGNGTRLVITAPGEDNHKGAAYVYDYRGGSWTQVGHRIPAYMPSNTFNQYYFGTWADMSSDGSIIVFGVNIGNISYGGAFMFRQNISGEWDGLALFATDYTPDTDQYGAGSAYSGGDVSISGDGSTIAFGVINDNSSTGGVWVYRDINKTGNFTLEASKLIGSDYFRDGLGFPKIGSRIALSYDGSTMAVLAPGDMGNIGAVRLWNRTNGIWSQDGSAIVITCESLALTADGKGLVIGYDDTLIRSMKFYLKVMGVWTQQGPAYDFPRIDEYILLAMSDLGNRIVVGMSRSPSNQNGDHNGTAYVLTMKGGPFNFTGAADAWTFTQLPGIAKVPAISGDGEVIGIGDYEEDVYQGAVYIYT